MFLPNAVIMGCDAIRANLDSLADALGLAPGDNDCGALHFSGDLAVRSAAKVLSLFLAHEVLKGNESFYAPYIDALPVEPASPAYALAAAALAAEPLAVVRARGFRAALAPSPYALATVTDLASNWLEFASLGGAGNGPNSHYLLAWMTTEPTTLQRFDLYPAPTAATRLALPARGQHACRGRIHRGGNSARC